MSNFSLQYQYISKQTGDKNKENDQLGNIALMDHQIMKSSIKTYV